VAEGQIIIDHAWSTPWLPDPCDGSWPTITSLSHTFLAETWNYSRPAEHPLMGRRRANRAFALPRAAAILEER
jgi:hypothetical protein